MNQASKAGLFVAIAVIVTWLVCLVFLLRWQFSWSNPVVYLMVLVQMHLYTGLFITAHDAMHGTIYPSERVNFITGQICTALYAAFSFKKLNIKHHQHHKYVHSDLDPDYSEGSFIRWYFKFMPEYMSVLQFICMAVSFNVLAMWFPQKNLVLFWVAPALLSTLQLFYFGTWLPHHGEHNNKHYSGTQKKNHLLGFLSCYFFGYHYEHHEYPGIPWWKLWKTKP
ncbi:beta-carotene ketolase (CrtW type) [Arcticibacter tournemirensis]|uniref:Fatty acid desaturase n=1 Tax=Arcticibacter tournemirensis TaxID=699437 RepID=A0A5M9H8B5_9SPHI|nr:fatty acid desaturase [Arcticibacter tournemirensis]KAA8482559.1 fatty acid desaturase [Arcticibacter tournemirensis]TQM52526.1 beta-carotene ketolase (CrtW type) [Arcticibacter tournemirensis]